MATIRRALARVPVAASAELASGCADRANQAHGSPILAAQAHRTSALCQIPANRAEFTSAPPELWVRRTFRRWSWSHRREATTSNAGWLPRQYRAPSDMTPQVLFS